MKKRINLYIREDQLKKLEARSKEIGSPVAEIVRRAIDAYLKKK
jgi:predicted DNA-binding protein